MFQLKRDVFIADSEDQRTVRRAVFLKEQVVAHDALATYGNPEVGSLRGTQAPPIQSECPGLYTKTCFRTRKQSRAQTIPSGYQRRVEHSMVSPTLLYQVHWSHYRMAASARH